MAIKFASGCLRILNLCAWPCAWRAGPMDGPRPIPWSAPCWSRAETSSAAAGIARAGQPHAEIEAIRDAQRGGHNPKGATLYVTLEPCSTHGRTPPCTQAIIAAGIRRVVAGATRPQSRHAGRGFRILRRAGLSVTRGVLAGECEQLNEAFNHWIVRRTPFVTVKAAMSLDGKIATVTGESKWITGEPARALAMKLRAGADAVLVGVNTIVKDDPGLTVRLPGFAGKPCAASCWIRAARTPLAARDLMRRPRAFDHDCRHEIRPGPNGWRPCGGACACWWRPPGAGGLTCPGCCKRWAGKMSPACWWKAAARPTPCGCRFASGSCFSTRRSSWADGGVPPPSRATARWRRAAKSPCATSDGGGVGGDLLLIARVNRPE